MLVEDWEHITTRHGAVKQDDARRRHPKVVHHAAALGPHVHPPVDAALGPHAADGDLRKHDNQQD